MSELGNDGTGKSTARSRRTGRGQHRRSALRRLADKGYHRAVWNRLGDGWHSISRRKCRNQVGEQPTPDRYFYDLARLGIGRKDSWPRWHKSADLVRLRPDLEWNIYLNYVATTPLRRRLEIIEMENHR